MAITKIQAGALPADVITTAAIDDASITHAKLHTTMDLSSKTVTLPTLNQSLTLDGPDAGVAKLRLQAEEVHGDIEGINIGNNYGGLAFKTNNNGTVAERVRIDNAGNVGIGTSSFGAIYDKLAVAGGINIQDDNAGKLEIGRYSSGIPNSYIKLGANSSSLRFTNNADNADLVIIENGGNVGIGTNSPTTRLSFGNYIPSNGQTIHTYQNGNTVSGLGIVSSVHRMFTNTGSSLSYGHVSSSDGSTYTERMRIDASGNVGIGTSSPNHWASYTDSAATVLQVRNTSQRARIAINGGNGAHLDLVDYAGSANDKHMNIAVDGGILKFGSLNDAGNAWVKDGIMVMDLGLGTVQLGKQPAFVATTTASSDITSQAVIPYNSNLYDRGTNFNTANHRFTAPVTGLYTFTTYHWHKNNTGGRAHLYLYLNGGVNFEFRNTRASSHNEYNRVGFTTTVAMSANDYVHVEGQGAGGGELHTSAGQAYSHFSGYLIG
ncbi:complement C1q domain-containing protein [Gammaproteobacteria bacterium]|nr:complement C1q domain-containing protein [Gammaproteobacteria bacterium]